MGHAKWLIIMFFLITATLFIYDGAKMMTVKRDMQTAVSIAASGSLVTALDPAPLRIGEPPRINDQLLKDNLQDIFVKNFGMRYKRIDVKVYNTITEPPAVMLVGESPVNASLLGFLQGNAGQEKNIRGRAAAVYEAKSLTR